MQDSGYFGPESMTWKITSEAVLLLAGARAVLMQVAHPLVAAAVIAHGRYLQDPLGRAESTFLLSQRLLFGSASTARQAAHTINRMHLHVSGQLPLDAGEYSSGTPYQARDPELLLWVHATLVESFLVAYPLFVGPLSAEEQEQYYQESKRTAPLFGLPVTLMPPTVEDLRRYIQDMLASNRLAITPQARQIARTVLFPPIPVFWFPLLHLHLQFTCALLPAEIREIYGLRWGNRRQRLFEWTTALMRLIIPRLPLSLRVWPETRKIIERSKKCSPLKEAG